MWLWIVLIIIIVLLIYFFLTYNTLVVLENRIDNAWSQIDVQLKKRVNLIPNLVKTIKGYAKHEKTVFTDVTKARASMARAKSVEGKMKSHNMLTEALGRLFAVAENYPKLEASKNFMQLQEELSGIEGKIAYARQFYNDSTLKYNNKIELFPSNIVALMLGRTKEKPYFSVSEKERGVPEVNF